MTAGLAAKSSIERFGDLFKRGIEHIHEAATVYADAVDADPDLINAFKEAFPGIPHGAWSGFEAVGRGWIDRRLLWGGGKASAALKRLPISQQSSALNSGVEILSSDGSALTVKVEDLSKAQTMQVFTGNHIRTLSEQRAWIEDRRQAKSDPPVLLLPYEIKRGKVIVRQPTTFTKRDLVRMLLEVEK